MVFPFLLKPRRSNILSNIKYTTGTTIKVKNNELVNPPTITHAKPFFHSAPAPLARAIGSIPNTMAMVVIKIGRKRAWLASTSASLVSLPSAFKWLVKSTRIIAFLATRPISIIKPKMVKIPIELLVKARASKAPITAKGRENITTKG
ncbi:hypothetical protein D3C85_1063580 [compost metagenome]